MFDRGMRLSFYSVIGIAIALLCVDPTLANLDEPESPAAKTSAAAKTSPATPTQPRRDLFSGKVIMLQEALARRGIKSTDEFKNQVVLETKQGELLPLVPDWRGRAFYQDERLRNRDVDLVARRRPGIPYLQVLMVFTYDKEGVRQHTDYWCDICSIPMYEIKACECCQGEIRLRFQSQDLPDYVDTKPAVKTAKPSATSSQSATDAADAKNIDNAKTN